MNLRLCHLYPDHLNIYADRGNIAVLAQRCRWRGIEVGVLPCGIGEPLPDADLLYVGGGQDRDQLLVAEDLAGRADAVRAAVDGGAALLAVCGGYQLLGHAYHGQGRERIPGIGLVDLHTEAGSRRMIGNVALSCELEPGRPHTLVGFENHAGRTYLGPGVRPLGRVLHGHGNNGEDGCEGVRAGRVLGTYVHGPLLPKNPWLADWLIAEALARRNGPVALEPLDDRLELEAHRAALAVAAHG